MLLTKPQEELIARLVRHRNALDSSRLLTDEGGGAGVGRAGKVTLIFFLSSIQRAFPLVLSVSKETWRMSKRDLDDVERDLDVALE